MSNDVSPSVIADLNPEIEYVNGNNVLKDCKFSGSIGIGKFAPVIDNCTTTNTSAIKRPTLPAADTKKNTMDMNVMLANIANTKNIPTFSTCSCNASNVNAATKMA